MDHTDPVALGSRALFPDLAPRAYLNHCGVSPASTLVRRAAEEVLGRYAQRGAGAFPVYMEQRARLKGKLAGMIGASADDIALVASTTTGIVDVALCFPWEPGDRVLCFQGEFPTNVTPWQRAAERYGLNLEFLSLAGFGDGSGDGLARLERALRAPTRLVAVSAVQFQTGLRMPIEAMADLCHAAGAQLFVDGIQAVGVIPLDHIANKVDYLCAGSHKWLMGLEGCAFLYVHPERAPRLRPVVAGWLSHVDSLTFLFEGEGHLRYDRPLKPRAEVLEGGATNSLGFAALEAAVGPLITLGPAAIHAHVNAYLDALERGLLARGFQSGRAADPAARSCILSARPPEGPSLPVLVRELGLRGVDVAMPDGWLRFGPHWPNALSEVPMVLDALDEAVAAAQIGG